MEVIMVSKYTSPVVLSFTTRLELTLKRPGLDTIPMDIVPTGISQSTSTSSGVLKQATTPAKPQGGVGSLTNASVLAGGGDFGGDGAFRGLDGGLMEVVGVRLKGSSLFSIGAVVSWGGFPHSYHRLGWVYYCVQPGVLWSHLWYRWHLWGVGGARGISGDGSRSQGVAPFLFGEVYSPKNFILEGKVEILPLSLVLLCSPPEGMAGPSLVGYFAPQGTTKLGAYATVFSLGISQMSRQAKVDTMGGMNLCWWRHGGAGGAWNGASLGSSSCICLGS